MTSPTHQNNNTSTATTSLPNTQPLDENVAHTPEAATQQAHAAPVTLDSLLRDITTTATLSGVPYSEAIIRQSLAVFEDRFTNSPVEFRITNKPDGKRSMNYRYVELDKPDEPLERARRFGMLLDQHRYVDNLTQQVREAFPMFGYGVDMDVQNGLEKIWPFLKGAVPVEKTYELSAVPRSVQENDAFYKKYGLKYFNIVAVDYIRSTMNLYFRIDDTDVRNPETIKQMLTDLGFSVPMMRTLNLLRETAVVAITYTWDTPRIERICFYVPAMGRETINAWGSPLFNRVAESVPMLGAPGFVPAWTSSRKGDYLKLGIDYTGGILPVFQRIHVEGITTL